MRVARRLGIGGMVAIWLALSAPAAARAWVKTATAAGDPATTFIVSARTLTVRSSDPVLLEFARNSEVEIGCGSGPSGFGPGGAGRGQWGAHANSLTVHAKPHSTFSKAIGFCRASAVEAAFVQPFMFSEAGFTPLWRRRFRFMLPPAPYLAHQQLSGYWWRVGVFLPPRFHDHGVLIRLPSARKVAQVLNRGLGRPRSDGGVLYARTLAGVITPHVVYVVGQGSSSHTLVLAVIGLDAKLHVAHGMAGTPGPPKFGPG